MCAIIGQAGGKLNKENFLKARDLMKKRGPDDSGEYFDEKNSVALGHRRLSILDLSLLGHQPMVSTDGRYVITFNGEIFNFVELKKELPEYKFRSDSDTEVLLAAYIQWGPECLKKLNGQFAFAIYDALEKEIFCARDRLGIKPFYYSLDNGAFYFASEIKALLALGVKAKPNDRIIYEYLRYGFYDHDPKTFFDGIQRLEPGHYAVWKNGTLKTSKYWDLADLESIQSQYENIEEKEALSIFQDLVSDAIRLQFRSDVPVGLNLSSGLDSLSMLFFSEKLTGGKLRLFSAGLADSDYDEIQDLKNVLSPDQKNLLTTSLLKPEIVWKLADKLLNIQDEPYGGFSTINYFNLYDSTGIPGVSVLLEGQGMDEILAGYSYYGTRKALANISQDSTKEGAPEVLRSTFAGQFSDVEVSHSAPFKDALRNFQYRDIRYTKLPRVLRFNDHISLAYSKELRVPYLDHRLVEFCFFLPERLKIHGDKHKWLLRKAMQGVVPDTSKDKPKKFFGAFQTEWFRKYFKSEIMAVLQSPSFKNRQYWDADKARLVAEKFFAGEGDNSFFLWQWINFYRIDTIKTKDSLV